KGCHVPTLRTAALSGVPEVSNQVIHPYTDLLVHDMGPALADGRRDFAASGSEWRTAPLWGIGLLETVNNHTNLLHDGRARGLLEAVLWHGGEATRARERVKRMSAQERNALVAFLQSLWGDLRRGGPDPPPPPPCPGEWHGGGRVRRGGVHAHQGSSARGRT